MKYKLFESFLSRNNDVADSLIKELTLSFKNVIGKLKSTENEKFNIKRGFLDNGKIFIYVHYKKQKLFSCVFNSNDRNVEILYTKYKNWYDVDTSSVDDVILLIDDFTSNIKPFGASVLYTLDLESASDLKTEFDIYITSNKYNM